MLLHLHLVKVIRLTHLDAIKYMSHSVNELLGGVLHLPEHPTGVPDQGPRQPGGDLPHIRGHGLVQRLVLHPHVGDGCHQLVQAVIRTAESQGNEAEQN